MTRALVIAHEPADAAGQIEVRLRQRGVDVQTHVVTPDPARPAEANAWPADADDVDLLVVMGSERSLTDSSAYDHWLTEEIELIRRAEADDRPVLGICFGGQLLASMHGGTVERSPTVEIGWYRLDVRPDAPIGCGPWMQWHHDRFLLPDHIEALASTAAGPQLFRIRRTVGTQFHPEVDRAHVARWMSGMADEYLVEHGLSRDEMLDAVGHDEARNIEQCHAFVDWFLDDVAFPDTE